MAQFFGLIPLNAANFESGSATNGQVLSADGSGGASWETVEGGSGDVQGVDVKSSKEYLTTGMIVTNAGTISLNGTYLLQEELYEGKSQYVSGDNYLFWDGNNWLLVNDDNLGYFSAENTLTPDLVTEWHILEPISMRLTFEGCSDTLFIISSDTQDNRPMYASKVGTIASTDSVWWLTFYDDLENNIQFYSQDDVYTPDLATTWVLDIGQTEIIPTLAMEAVHHSIVISNAGISGLNGEYYLESFYNSKYVYVHGDGHAIVWDGSIWTINGTISEIEYSYTSEDDVATPDLVTTWALGLNASLPLPTATYSDITKAELPLPTVTADTDELNTNVAAGKVLSSNGSGGASWASPLTFSTTATEGDVIQLRDDLFAALGFTHTPHNTNTCIYKLSYLVFTLYSNDTIYLLWHEGGEVDYWKLYAKRIMNNKAAASWCSDTVQFLGCTDYYITPPPYNNDEDWIS